MHLAAENINYTSHIDVLHVPHKGGVPAVVNVIAGQVQFATPNVAAVISFVEQRKLRAPGVTSKQRSPQLPDVPGIAESLPGFENLGWFGLMASVGNTRAEFAKAIREEKGHWAKIVRARKIVLERRVHKLREIA